MPRVSKVHSVRLVENIVGGLSHGREMIRSHNRSSFYVIPSDF